MLAVSAVYARQQVKYVLIGGLRIGVHGQGRATEDADFLLHIPALQRPPLLEAMAEAGCTVDVVQSIRDWNDGGMLVVLGPGGVHIDCFKAVSHCSIASSNEHVPKLFGSQVVRVADAEGLLLLKLIAFRSLDQEGIRGILAANVGRLGLDWVRHEATLAGLDPNRMAEFEGMVQEF